ncbi:MAG: substrate-binding domain-containing protein [Caldilineaceae bacterium]|nr:substrate-binding domain-containing protein [Caldilineaceae bacterium]
MNRTRITFVVIIVVALLLVGATLIIRNMGSTAGTSGLTVEKPESVTIRILTALPVEPWVRRAAQQFNAANRTVDGVPVQVQVEAVDGLTALGRWDRDEYGALPANTRLADLSDLEREELEDFPVAWIPDSRYLVELANAAYKERLGRDVFLTDGEYRARPIAISLFAWGLYNSRAEVLEKSFGDIDWNVIHDAAIARGGWPELGGEPAWGFFKLVVPNPAKNVGGLAAMIAAAGEYYDRTNISVEDVTNPDFQKWLQALMSAVTDFSSSSAYTAEDFALFGYSVGDGGQLLESDLLQNMQGILTRWEDPLQIYYPKYVTWFDFPFSVWVGPETTALQKNAALEFQRFLLSEEQQQAALAFGLRPANPTIPVDAIEGSLFVQWADRGVLPIVPRTTAMRSPDRDTLLALLRWFELNVNQ